eukprot:SM000096S24869  [mRNA]  locus=s96:219839:221112:+ [translate_table: standard]
MGVAGRFLQDNEALIPDILRLALNDIATYDKCGSAQLISWPPAKAPLVPVGPPWTLRLQDPATMMQATATGGPNGSVRLRQAVATQSDEHCAWSEGADAGRSEELGRPENAGLDKALGLLGSVKTKLDDSQADLGGPIGWADLIQYAGRRPAFGWFTLTPNLVCGGYLRRCTWYLLKQISRGSSAAPLSQCRDTQGRRRSRKGQAALQCFWVVSSAAAAKQRCVLASATPFEGARTLSWGAFEKLLGRTDTAAADPAGRVMDWEAASVADLKAKFVSLGLTGRQRQERSCMRPSVSLPAAPAAMALQLVVFSVFLGPDLEKTEAKLATDSELAGYVTKYQRSRKTISETDYEV